MARRKTFLHVTSLMQADMEGLYQGYLIWISLLISIQERPFLLMFMIFIGITMTNQIALLQLCMHLVYGLGLFLFLQALHHWVLSAAMISSKLCLKVRPTNSGHVLTVMHI